MPNVNNTKYKIGCFFEYSDWDKCYEDSDWNAVSSEVLSYLNSMRNKEITKIIRTQVQYKVDSAIFINNTGISIIKEPLLTKSYITEVKQVETPPAVLHFTTYKSITFTNLKYFFEALTSQVYEIVLNPRYLEIYTPNELIELGKSLKYINQILLIDQADKQTVRSTKLNYLVAYMGSELNKESPELKAELQKHLPTETVSTVVSFLSFLQPVYSNRFWSAQKKAINAIKPEKAESFCL